LISTFYGVMIAGRLCFFTCSRECISDQNRQIVLSYNFLGGKWIKRDKTILPFLKKKIQFWNTVLNNVRLLCVHEINTLKCVLFFKLGTQSSNERLWLYSKQKISKVIKAYVEISKSTRKMGKTCFKRWSTVKIRYIIIKLSRNNRSHVHLHGP